MKKILFILMCIFAVSCDIHEYENCEPEIMPIVSFTHQIVMNDSVTRATSDDVLSIIKDQTPNYVNVTLVNIDSNQTFTCKSNESITVPSGNYKISANIDGNFVTIGNREYKWCPYYSTPHLKCNTFTQYIDSNTKTINLNIYYDCYAVFALVDECESASFCYDDDNYQLPQAKKYYFAFFKSAYATVILTPYYNGDGFIKTIYNFSTIYNINDVVVEFGNWYTIHPQKVDSNQIYM